MSNEIAKIESGAMMVYASSEKRNAIHLALNELMIDGVHYGKIPGCGDKPALLKAGCEVIASMFGLSPKFEVEKEELDYPGHREITVTANIYDRAENFLGSGVGSCSTMESKYRWRNAGKVCPECGNQGSIFTSQEKFGGGFYCNKGKGGCGKAFKTGTAGEKEIRNQKGGKIENPDIADQYNTVLKMAKKRALVDAILTVTAASDVFEQDLDEFGEADLEAIREEKRQRNMKPETVPPQAKKTETKTKKKPAKVVDQDTIPEGPGPVVLQPPEPETSKTLDEWKAEADKQESVSAWWVDVCRKAGKELTTKQYAMLEQYLEARHGVKF